MLVNMNKKILKRIIDEANFVLETNNNIRDTAKVFGVSKSTVHKDLHERLFELDISLFEKIANIFGNHLSIRHINGGEATRQKYAK